MKRQYRYKTAADTKDFFTRDWFNELNDLVGELHDEILNAYNDKDNTLSKMWDTVTREPSKMCNYIDAYAFPKDNCAKIMGILSDYESWYTTAWTFLEQDSYDKKLKESINKCDFIDTNLTKFAGEKGKEVTDQLTEINGNIGRLLSCFTPPNSINTGGFDKSKNDKIDEFLSSLAGTAKTKVQDKLTKMQTLLGNFIAEIGIGTTPGTNQHYWTAAAAAGSVIKTKASELKTELLEQKQRIKDDADAEHDKKKEEKVRKDLSTYDMDDACKAIEFFKNRVEKFIDKTNADVKGIAGSPKFASITSAYGSRGIADRAAWEGVCDGYFENIKTMIVDGLDTRSPSTSPGSVQNAFDNNGVLPLVNKLLKQVKDQFNKTTVTSPVDPMLLEVNENTSGPGPLTVGTGGAPVIKEFQEKLKGLFKILLDELYNNSVA